MLKAKTLSCPLSRSCIFLFSGMTLHLEAHCPLLLAPPGSGWHAQLGLGGHWGAGDVSQGHWGLWANHLPLCFLGPSVSEKSITSLGDVRRIRSFLNPYRYDCTWPGPWHKAHRVNCFLLAPRAGATPVMSSVRTVK